MSHKGNSVVYTFIETERVISCPVIGESSADERKNPHNKGVQFEAVGCDYCLGDLVKATFALEDEVIVAFGWVSESIELDSITSDIKIVITEIDKSFLRLLD